MASTRLYKVTVTAEEKVGGEVKSVVVEERLIEAANQLSAIRHAVEKRVTCGIASQSDCVRMAAAGVVVEQAVTGPAQGDLLDGNG